MEGGTKITMAKRETCFFCGAEAEVPETLLHGARGPICRICVYALAARLTEADAKSAPVGDATGMVTITPDADAPVDDDRSAHDYQTRIDLAAAYAEMGRKGAAVNELLGAVEAAIFCDDFKTALRCVARARKLADSPSLRDRVCDIFTRMAPLDERGG